MKSIFSMFMNRVSVLIGLNILFAVYFGVQLQKHFELFNYINQASIPIKEFEQLSQLPSKKSDIVALKGLREELPKVYHPILTDLIEYYAMHYNVLSYAATEKKKESFQQVQAAQAYYQAALPITVSHMRYTVLLWVASFLLFCFFQFRFLRYQVLKPIEVLSSQIQKVVGSSSDSERLSELSQVQYGEFGHLGLLVRALYDDLYNQNKALKEFNRSKDAFVSIASHELRTPLAAILASLKMFVRTEEFVSKEGRPKQLISMALNESERLIDLVNNLLDLMASKTGNLSLRKEWISVRSLFQFSQFMFSDLAREKKIQIDITLEEDLDIFVDESSFKQILSNLISNAIKFTPKEGQVRLSVYRGEGQSWILSVRDSGIGVAAEDKESIFDIFYQTESGRSVPEKSTGLGLAIVKSLIEAHEAKVKVNSDLGQGLEVCICFYSNFRVASRGEVIVDPRLSSPGSDRKVA